MARAIPHGMHHLHVSAEADVERPRCIFVNAFKTKTNEKSLQWKSWARASGAIDYDRMNAINANDIGLGLEKGQNWKTAGAVIFPLKATNAGHNSEENTRHTYTCSRTASHVIPETANAILCFLGGDVERGS